MGYLKDVASEQVIEMVYHLLMAASILIAHYWKETQAPDHSIRGNVLLVPVEEACEDICYVHESQ